MSQQNLMLVYGFLAWIILHGFMMACRLPFSNEKLARLKAWGVGVGFLTSSIVIVVGGHWLFSIAEKPVAHLLAGAHPLVQALSFFVLAAVIVMAGMTAFSLLLGHMVALVTSWSASDFEQEFRR